MFALKTPYQRVRLKRILLSVALVCLSWAVAGCGGGAASPKTASAGSGPAGGSEASAQFTDALEFARCMRSHGEPNFPDPRNPGGFSTGALAALNTSSPAFVSATDTCQRLLPNAGQPTAAQFQQAMGNGLRFAKCMRAHHVYFPDPEVAGAHMTIDLSNVNTNAPAYSRAARLCATVPGG